jgi:ligand-binding sensor domain-containing protein
MSQSLPAMTGIRPDGRGDLWVSIDASRRIARIDRTGDISWLELASFQPAGDEADNFVAGIQIDGRGDVWVGALRGLLQVRDGQPVKRWTESDGFTGPNVAPKLVLADGRLVVSMGTPAVQHRALATVSSAAGVELIPGDVATRVVLEEKGELWTGGDDGVWLLREGEWRHLSKAPAGLPSDVATMIFDPDGALWAGTSRGVFRASREEIDDVLAGRKTGPVAVRWFGTADGLSAKEVWLSAQDSEGRLYFGTIDGVSMLDPRAVGVAGSTPKARIRGFRGDGAALAQPAFPAGTRRFEIDYTASGLRREDALRFQ